MYLHADVWICRHVSHRYTLAAQDLLMRSRGVLKERGWRLPNDKLGSGDDITVFVIPLAGHESETWRDAAATAVTALAPTVNPSSLNPGLMGQREIKTPLLSWPVFSSDAFHCTVECVNLHVTKLKQKWAEPNWTVVIGETRVWAASSSSATRSEPVPAASP